MVAGYHLIWTVYGYWLPNDPRGSTSQKIRVEPIAELGDIHYGRKPIQPPSSEIRSFHEKAQDVLKHPVLTLQNDDIAVVGRSFGQIIAAEGYVCYGCAIMPDHVHILIRRHTHRAEEMIELLQEESRQALIESENRSATHPVWTKGSGWKGFLNTARDFERTIKYINANPIEIGWPEQLWDFVQRYDGWLPNRNFV